MHRLMLVRVRTDPYELSVCFRTVPLHFLLWRWIDNCLIFLNIFTTVFSGLFSVECAAVQLWIAKSFNQRWIGDCH